jgi:heparosan-N-sulfate-glucuronate 5-epimerase
MRWAKPTRCFIRMTPPQSRTDAAPPAEGSLPERSYPGFFSSAKSFALPAGRQFGPDGVRGYYIDLRVKAEEPVWPHPSLGRLEDRLWVRVHQWGLGAYERYLAGEGQQWLRNAMEVGRYALSQQVRGGPRDGLWLNRLPYTKTFQLPAGWPSAMAQGEGASLFARLHLETGEERWADAARRAVAAMRLPSAEGGVQASLDGAAWPEEYPTDPPSCVLNGGIFALWGLYDVGVALADQDVRRQFEQGADMLAANLHRWDTGYWSRYDLFPHPVMNVASSFYHALHTSQLEAMHVIAPRAEFEAAARRFARYSQRRANAVRAFARKVLFRLAVPRNDLVGRPLRRLGARRRPPSAT